MGGTVTAEHGVGLLGRERVARELCERVHALHGELERLLDPAGILNPGAGF